MKSKNDMGQSITTIKSETKKTLVTNKTKVTDDALQPGCTLA